MESEKNILGNRLEACSLSPATGFNRNGHCQHTKQDLGAHGVCSEVTEEFLNFTRDRGNDLSSPNELYGFPGLKPGDRWCLSATRWKEALDNGAAPPVVLSATNKAVLRYISLDDLIEHACEDSFGQADHLKQMRHVPRTYKPFVSQGRENAIYIGQVINNCLAMNVAIVGDLKSNSQSVLSERWSFRAIFELKIAIDILGCLQQFKIVDG